MSTIRHALHCSTKYFIFSYLTSNGYFKFSIFSCRAHASTEGVTAFIATSVAGFLLQKELDYLQGAVDVPKRPFAAIVGGSKVSSKISVIEAMLSKVSQKGRKGKERKGKERKGKERKGKERKGKGRVGKGTCRRVEFNCYCVFFNCLLE
jgi:Phosphoglycerate kinase